MYIEHESLKIDGSKDAPNIGNGDGHSSKELKTLRYVI